ncbi:MAG: SagB family peptide dehydrogenase [Rhodospirillales bacterium]|nr:SagB family peptide dehydrogenase [Rhodospirillales bacterium]
MRPSCQLSLKSTVSLIDDGDDVLVADCDGRAVRIHAADTAVRAMVKGLAGGGRTAESLCGEGMADHAEAAFLSQVLGRIVARGFACSTLVLGDRRLATLEPISTSYRPFDVPAAGRFRLSRFAWMHRLGEESVLESPLGHARVVLHDGSLAGLAGMLAQPRSAADLADAGAGVDQATAAVVLRFLVNAGVAFAADSEGRLDEDRNVALRQWEFHDLLFHSRSRAGRQVGPIGSAARFKGDIPTLPAVKPPMSDRRVRLYKPDLAALAENDPSFSRVCEARASIRRGGERPIAVDQLGEFLYRSVRIKSLLPPVPEKGLPCEVSMRPCCSGGAIHPLEVYLSVHRVEGLDSGFYHYDPLRHELEWLSEWTPLVRCLLIEACGATGVFDRQADVLLTLAARVPRTAWKYQAIAYSLILKDLGALFQQMYLVATAQGLAPCAIGGGNSDLFAQVSGLDYYEETAVGEFILSSRPSAVHAAPAEPVGAP